MASVADGGKKRTNSRSAGFVYSALATALVVVIAALAITANQTPPPAIAELAPQAVQQIKEAPADQASSVGSAEGGGGTGEGVAQTTTTTAPPAATAGPAAVRVAPRTRRCVDSGGGIPRQTEDPQSPPCVPLWEGTDNGGATSKGVTANEIVIAVPGGSATMNRDWSALEAYFNKRYEFYGRKLHLVPYKSADQFTTGDKMAADAVYVDEQLHAFASLSYSNQAGQEAVYYDALARRKIISVGASFVGTHSSSESDLAKNAPYEWNYYASVDLIERNMAEMICKQLVNRPPSFAGAPQNAAPVRKFGLVVDTTVKGAPPVNPDPLLAPTRRCGVQWDVHQITVPSNAEEGNAGKNSLLQMQNNGVTTIVCLCTYSELRNGLMDNAAANGYSPEYIVQNYGDQDTDNAAIAYRNGQQLHVLGVRTWNKSLPLSQMPHWNAKREVDPTIPEGIYPQSFDTTYWNLLLIASGIQLAGPRLTPETFQQGLQRAKFPNPSCGAAPYYQACVGFEGGTHTMIKDFAFVWWDPTQRSVEYDPSKQSNTAYQTAGQGAYCYSGLGARYGLGAWPGGPPQLFSGTCR